MSQIDTKQAVFIGLGTTVVGTGAYLAYQMMQSSKYKKIIDDKRTSLESTKRNMLDTLKNDGTPSSNVDKLTSLRIKDLIAGINAGAFSANDVLKAYQLKAIEKDKEFNFIVQFNPNAEEDAKRCITVKRAGLKGVPLSVKDCIDVKDCDCTFGNPSLAFNPCKEDSAIIATMRLQGAVPFVMTNMAQVGIGIESSNPLFGFTKNPHNPSKTCGGSSGGEAAILACEASLVGLGTDVGGSVRIPAHYCGIYAIKPTSARFSKRHVKKIQKSQKLINASLGPMTRNLDDLVDVFKAIACGDLYHLDPQCPPLCFNEKIYDKKRPLRIGKYINIGEDNVEPIPAVKRAVEMATRALEKAGHSVEEIQLPRINEAFYDLYVGVIFSDGGATFLSDFIGYNPVDSTISTTVNALKPPNFLKHIISYLLAPIDSYSSKCIRRMAGTRTVYGFNDLQSKLDKYREDVLTLWQGKKLDGIVCPVLPIVAPPLNASKHMMNILVYTAIYNVLDYPAGSVPITKVNQTDIDQLVGYPETNSVQKLIKENMKDTLNLPVGVQCVALMFREETCLRMMRDITLNL